MNNPAQREEELFAAALALPVAKRQQYLNQVCGDDAKLRERIEALLRAHDEAGNLLEDAPGGAVRAALSRPALEEKPGATIGRYKLLQKIGEGGCGAVFMAEQQEPLVRRVALKVIKLGMDTKEVIARFEAERQALAMMDHPNIAKVLDAGATETGRPYFVMELVRGVKITDYCDQQNLSTTERLNLFVQVCHAIQHAHQKGIIHRDIKPSNILVTLQDGAPMPKVIDFGIAKATQGRLTDQTFFTAFEQFIGTPAYMSPEQAQLSSEDVDTRSDIYSLGVLLYELLTGQTPFDAKELIKAGLDEIRRVIREDEPPTPSTRLRTLVADAMTTTAQHRATVPPKLLHLIRGDLDWIVMRCLEKNRGRRYPTTDELARDLERHLHNEPVTACPPTTLYRIHKLYRRNKLAVLTTTAVAAALMGGTAVSIWQAQRAIAAERKSAQAVRVFRKMLAEIGPTVTLHAKSGFDHDGAMWWGILDNAAAQIPRESQFQPDLAADITHVFGKIYLAGGRHSHAEAMLRTTLVLQRQSPPADPLEFAQTNYDLGLTLIMQGHSAEAEALLRAALAIRRARLGPEHPEAIRTLEDLGFFLWTMGDHLPAERLLREAVALRQKCGTIEKLDNPNLPPLWGLSICLSFLEQFDEADALARQNLALVQRTCEAHHPFVRSAHELLGDCLSRRGDYVAALVQWRAALEIDRATLPADHPMLVFSTYGVANCLHQLGDLAGAEPLYRESLALWRQRITIGDREFILRLDGLAGLLQQRGQFDEARALLDEAWAELQDPKHAEWLDFWPEVIRGQVELLATWERAESARTAEIASWNARQQEFEAATLMRPPGRDRVNALRGLCSTYRRWAAHDPAQIEHAAFWQEKLRECWKNPPAANRDPNRQ